MYSFSHDLRAPLRHISEFARILGEDYHERLDERGRDYLQRMQRGAAKMTVLINSLLNLSRVVRHEVDRMKIDLSKLACSIVSELRNAKPGRDVEVVITEDLFAFADLRLAEIVLSNLFENAWKFTSKTKDARIEFGAVQGDGKNIYYVKDNGSGFDQNYANKMFQPFQRLHSEKEFPGTGIGLTIVERIIQRHGGRIWAEAEVGKGATVYFTLE
jgi:light-regulated signal transduction histidine kinase (bacteriophytochrome)